MRFEADGMLRKRLACWVAEKIAGRRWPVTLVDTSIAALRAELNARNAFIESPCWCERCDTDSNCGFRTRMSVCPECGDKRCPRAEFHGNECSKAPNVK